MASFVLSFFPLDVLDEILDLIESVSEGFLTYSCINVSQVSHRFYSVHAANLVAVVGLTKHCGMLYDIKL